MTIFLDIEGLIDFFSFTAWIFYGVAAAAVIRLRFSRPDAPRPFKVNSRLLVSNLMIIGEKYSCPLQVPIVIPIIVVLISIFLVIAPIVNAPKVQYLYATGFIFLGFLLYFPFCHYKIVMPGMGSLLQITNFQVKISFWYETFILATGKLSLCMQLLFQVVPPESDPDAANILPSPSTVQKYSKNTK